MAALEIFIGIILMFALVSLAGLILLRKRQRSKATSVFDEPSVFQATASRSSGEDGSQGDAGLASASAQSGEADDGDPGPDS